MATRVYQYGIVGGPRTNADIVEEQLRAAHRYRNKLVEIERDRRDKARAVIAAHGDVDVISEQVKPLEHQLEHTRLQIKSARKITRTKSESPELRITARDIIAKLKVLRAEMKTIKQKVATDPVIQEKLTAIRDAAQERVRTERKSSGCWYGNYLLVEQAHDLACKSITPPHFVRWSPEGSLGVLLMEGIDLSELWGGNQLIQIDKVPPEVYQGTRSQLRQGSRTTLRTRVKSDENRKPIWVEWRMIMHRPLPEGCRIKNARLVRRRINCTQMRWLVDLTVELPENWRSGPLGTGKVGLNLGWSGREPGDIRSGYVVGEDGGELEIIVPRSVIDRVEKSESIRSIRDKNMDQMRADLYGWLTQRDVIATIPQWFTDRSQHIYAWRSANRFAGLVRAWKTQRWEGDELGYDLLEKWRYRDYHLEHYESGLRRHALNQRRDIYRVVAARLVAKYDTLVIDDTDLRKFQRSPNPESARVELDVVKRNQRHAAGSELRGALINAFKRSGGRVIEVSSHNVTLRCNACGHEQTDRPITIERTCSACGVLWDRDANACKNLLRLAREHDDAPPDTETARGISGNEIKESRSQRFRRAKREAAAARPLET